jgi:hypothetical protein
MGYTIADYTDAMEHLVPQQVTKQPNWWGNHALEVGQYLQIEIGAAQFAILRLAHEWQLYYNKVTAINDNGENWQVAIVDELGNL